MEYQLYLYKFYRNNYEYNYFYKKNKRLKQNFKGKKNCIV